MSAIQVNWTFIIEYHW